MVYGISNIIKYENSKLQSSIQLGVYCEECEASISVEDVASSGKKGSGTGLLARGTTMRMPRKNSTLWSLFSKKIRYEVRKLNAEKRPRMKGRFVKRSSFPAGSGPATTTSNCSRTFPLLAK